MRILLAAHAFPPRSTAGVEIYTSRLARALRHRGHEVLVLAALHDLGAQPGALRRRQEQGIDVVEVVNIHHRGTLEATYSDPDVERAAAGVFEAFRPDIVHFQHLLNLSAGLIGRCRAAGARVLMTLHDYWLSCPRDGLRLRAELELCTTMDHAVCARCLRDSPYLVPPAQARLGAAARSAGLGGPLHRLNAAAPAVSGTILRLVRRLSPAPVGLEAEMDRRAIALRTALRGVDHFLAPTRFALDRALEFGIAADHVEVAPLGAVVERARRRPADRRRRFGFIGSILPHKGLHVLIEAFRGLHGDDLALDIRGNLRLDAGYASALREAAGGDSRIRFLGAFAEGEQKDALSGIDVLVLPSVWWENSPLTVLEALAAGIPVVASAIGGVPELIQDGVSGLLVEPRSPDSLRAALADVAEGRRLAAPLDALPIRTIADEAESLEGRYRSLIDGARREATVTAG
jgi:glycosyltransferase involved in cell wall biosynthesis